MGWFLEGSHRRPSWVALVRPSALVITPSQRGSQIRKAPYGVVGQAAVFPRQDGNNKYFGPVPDLASLPRLCHPFMGREAHQQSNLVLFFGQANAIWLLEPS